MTTANVTWNTLLELLLIEPINKPVKHILDSSIIICVISISLLLVITNYQCSFHRCRWQRSVRQLVVRNYTT